MLRAVAGAAKNISIAAVAEAKMNENQQPVAIDSYTHFKQAVLSGEHWYIALLSSLRYWQIETEQTPRKNHIYLIDGEAFDHLLVCQRLLKKAIKEEVVPKSEVKRFLFNAQAPLVLEGNRLINVLGEKRLKECLNFFYGVTNEEALQLAVKDEVRKETQALGPHNEAWINNEAFSRIYGKTFDDLLVHFKFDKKDNRDHFSTEDLKEFTYFLFKYRINNNDKAKTASDTKKGLEKLKEIGYQGTF